jgi:sugar lactone lactonase YvrE
MLNPKILIASLFMTGVLCGPASADLIVTQGTMGVQRYTNDGVSLGTLIAPGTGGLTDARGVAVGPGGDLFVADFSNDNILRFNSSGGFLGVFTSGANVDTPLGIAFGTGGDLFVASAGPASNIARVDGTTGVVTNPSFTSGNSLVLGGPQYLTFGPDLAVTDIAGHLFRFDPTTGVSTFEAALDNPVGVTFDALGNLFVAQRISDNVLLLPAGGGGSSILIPNGAFTSSPADMKIGPDGLLYVTTGGAIYRFDTSGTLVDSFGTGGRYMAFTDSTVVPEPETWTLLGLGIVGAQWMRSRLRLGRSIG